MKKENSISRRSFLKSSALAGALGAIGTGSTVGVLTSCGGGESANAIKPLKEPGTYYVPELPDLATDGKELKAGVIGCGGRGSGAAFNFLNAANGVTIVALGDTFQERVDDLAKKLKFGLQWKTHSILLLFLFHVLLLVVSFFLLQFLNHHIPYNSSSL